MAETTFTFRVDEELKAAFSDVAAAQERTAAQQLRTLMNETVQRWHENQAHDAWFRGEVAQALTEADDPAAARVSHERVRSSWQQQREILEQQATNRPA